MSTAAMERKRLIARYAIEHEENLEVVTCFEGETRRQQLSKVAPRVETLSHVHPAAIWFERKMHEDFGIEIEGAFDTRPLAHHETIAYQCHPMRKHRTDTTVETVTHRSYDYETVEGEGVFQVGVGPIHAGIIEPGHFHFSQAGEEMLHLEVRHFYKYRAIEKMLEGKTLWEAKPIIERISGNASIAYQLCWRDIVVQSSGAILPEAARRYHAMLLELERAIHHLTDVGFIPNDAGFAAALAFASTLAEDARRQMQVLSAHRFGFGAIDFESKTFDSRQMRAWLKRLEEQVEQFHTWIGDIPSLWDRLDGTGILPYAKAVKYDCVGVVARASGVKLDRRDNDFYRAHGFLFQREKSGDVAARFKLRLAELRNSIEMMHHFADDSSWRCEILQPLRDGEYTAYCESALGELFMTITLKGGRIERCFVRDPSFVNWQALHLMMSGNIIADFPLINKSCDLSYAGNDL